MLLNLVKAFSIASTTIETVSVFHVIGRQCEENFSARFLSTRILKTAALDIEDDADKFVECMFEF